MKKLTDQSAHLWRDSLANQRIYGEIEQLQTSQPATGLPALLYRLTKIMISGVCYLLDVQFKSIISQKIWSVRSIISQGQ